MYAYILIFLLAQPATSLMGFDCGGQHLNITTISLLDVGECDLQLKQTNTSNVHIQLLQLSEYKYAEIIQCKVEISRTIFHCGMHSHNSIVYNGRADYVHETGYTQCLRLFQDGTISLGPENYLQGIRINETTSRSIMLAGKTTNDGHCKGVQYSDPYGTWDDVVVQGTAKISLRSGYVPVQLNTGRIILRSGTTCPLQDGFCIDSDHGYTYWKPAPETTCDFHQYNVLYEGPASRIQEDATDPASPIVYSLTTRDITFALTKTKEQRVCGYKLFQTEHPKLFILELKRGEFPPRHEHIPMENLDIFAYMNSKFVYVEKHIRNQMITLYHNVMLQKCELERQVINNALSFATLQPDEFAYQLMRGPGYMAVTSGEAVSVIKCIPVDVIVRKTKECFSELPVTLRNETFFLTPKSRILTKYGNQIECSSELPTLYRIEDTWVQFTPDPQVRQLPPQQLKPLTKLSWKYLTPGPLAISGIYSEKDIQRIREHIMFPAEKPAVLNSVVRGLTGHTFDSNSVSMYNLLDEASLEKIVDSTTSKVWKGFLAFGSATAGIFGIFLIIRIIKLIIDTAIHGYAIHTVYGCSMHLLGAVWSSLTHLLLHLAHGPNKKEKEKEAAAESAPAVLANAPQQPEEPVAVPPIATSSRLYAYDLEQDPRMHTTTYTYRELNDRLAS